MAANDTPKNKTPENEKGQPATQQNEGEGNRTAAKQYNEAQAAFVKSGKVDAAAKDAEQALEGPEAEELKKAEKEGLTHARH